MPLSKPLVQTGTAVTFTWLFDHLATSYRVFLNSARQDMVIVVPPGDHSDPTRDPSFYDPIYAYLTDLGFKAI